MNEEIQYLKEHLDAICRYKGLQEELTYNVPLEILKRVCIVLDYLQQKNKELKEMHYLIQGGRGNGKTYLTKLQQQLDLYKSVIDEIKGIVEETNYLANKTEIVNRGNIELHGVIDRLCLILRKIEIIDKAKESEESEIENN